MKIYFLLPCFFLFNSYSFAQEISGGKKAWSDSTLWRKTTTLFAEAGGYAFISPNIDKIFYVNRALKISARAGFSLLPGNQHEGRNTLVYLIPAGINFFWGKGMHHFQTGMGELYMNAYQYTNNNTSLETENTDIFITLLYMGYRYQKVKGGLFFQAGWTPTILAITNRKVSTLGSFIIFIPEVGIGYSFLSKVFKQ